MVVSFAQTVLLAEVTGLSEANRRPSVSNWRIFPHAFTIEACDGEPNSLITFTSKAPEEKVRPTCTSDRAASNRDSNRGHQENLRQNPKLIYGMI